MKPLPIVEWMRKRITRAAVFWAVVAIIVIVVGWIKNINLLFLLGYVLVSLLAVNAWIAWRSARRLVARRLPTIPVYPNEQVVAHIEVTNVSRFPATAVVTDEAGPQQVAWLLAPLAPRESTLVQTRWAFPARGRYRLGPLVANSAYPFGLIHALREIAEPGEVHVLPPIGSVNLDEFRRWLIRGGAGDSQTRRTARRSGPGYGDVRGLRPYRSGDSPREIHWKTSARRNQLLVREYDRTEPLDLVLILDPWLPANPSDEARRRLEWTLSLATTLATAWGDADSTAEVVLVVPGEPPTVRTGRATPGFVRTAFVCLAGLEGSEVVPAVPPGAVRHRSNRSARIVISSRSVSPIMSALRSGGLSVAFADAVTAPTWFTPPAFPLRVLGANHAV